MRSSARAMRAMPSRNPLRRHAGEGEPEAVGAALDHEVGAGDEGDALALGLGQQGGGVGALGEVEPEEVAAAGDDELGLGDLLAQRLDQRVAARLQGALDELDVVVEPARAQSSSTTASASMFGEM